MTAGLIVSWVRTLSSGFLAVDDEPLPLVWLPLTCLPGMVVCFVDVESLPVFWECVLREVDSWRTTAAEVQERESGLEE